MKLLIQTIFFAVALSACHPKMVSQNTPAPPPSWVKWDKTFVELGSVKKGEKRSFFYDFVNESHEPIQIEIVDACDCTKVEFPRGVIEKGGKGHLDIVFDSTEKEESEKIEIRIIWKNKDVAGNPRFDVLSYHFDLTK